MPLDDFENLGTLGKGSFSVVKKVRRKADGQVYALKLIQFESLKTRAKENALNEIRILASVTHPNVIAYKEAFVDSRQLCIVMEHAAQGDLLQQIQRRARSKNYFTEAEVWRVFEQALTGLYALHSLEILHRDIKCANILVSADDTIKLGDLNVSKVAAQAHTQTGTPCYLAPEVWDGHKYDQKCDVWSLGVSIYELASLDLPFKGRSMKDVYQRVTAGVYPSLPPRFSDDLAVVLHRMLQVDPRRRASCVDLLLMEQVQRNTTLHLDALQTSDQALLRTIQVPRHMQGLSHRLPAAKYANEQPRPAKNKRMTPSPSVKLWPRLRY